MERRDGRDTSGGQELTQAFGRSFLLTGLQKGHGDITDHHVEKSAAGYPQIEGVGAGDPTDRVDRPPRVLRTGLADGEVGKIV